MNLIMNILYISMVMSSGMTQPQSLYLSVRSYYDVINQSGERVTRRYCYVLAYGVQYGRRVNRVVVFMERERESSLREGLLCERLVKIEYKY
jgi:negative regulator of sigma E activity